MNRFARLLVVLTIGSGCGPRTDTVVHRDRPIAPLYRLAENPEQLDGPDRDRWQRPKDLVDLLGIRPGETVADVGAGTGYLMPHLSRAVGDRGKVIAQDVQREMVKRLKTKAQSFGNVQVIAADERDPNLPVKSVDVIIMLTVYHEVKDPVEFLRKLRLALRHQGRLVIIDFDPDLKGDPPPPVNHAVFLRDVLAEAAAAGFRFTSSKTLASSQFYVEFGCS